MRYVAVIPARLESTRLPRKVLADVDGRPILWHVWSRVVRASLLDEVFVATDAIEVATAVEEWGGRVLMTDSQCSCGTERIPMPGYPRYLCRVLCSGNGGIPQRRKRCPCMRRCIPKEMFAFFWRQAQKWTPGTGWARRP